jgi:hypothetical protein
MLSITLPLSTKPENFLFTFLFYFVFSIVLHPCPSFDLGHLPRLTRLSWIVRNLHFLLPFRLISPAALPTKSTCLCGFLVQAYSSALGSTCLLFLFPSSGSTSNNRTDSCSFSAAFDKCPLFRHHSSRFGLSSALLYQFRRHFHSALLVHSPKTQFITRTRLRRQNVPKSPKPRERPFWYVCFAYLPSPTHFALLQSTSSGVFISR